MAEQDAFDFIDDPDVSDTRPVLTHNPVYVEMGSGKLTERWHAVSTLCPQCGQRLVHATAPDGERLVLVVSARTWRLRLQAQKDGYVAERVWGYPEHCCHGQDATATPSPAQTALPLGSGGPHGEVVSSKRRR